MMGPPMQDGKAKAWLDERMTGSAPLLCAAAIQVGQRSNVASLENHDFPLGNPTG